MKILIPLIIMLTAPQALAAEQADPFIARLAVLILSGMVGFYVIWAVSPALHTPLMSMTNAISGIVIIGAIIAATAGQTDIIARRIGLGASVLATINIVGGFLVTRRMLAMYRRRNKSADK